jgi:hypothetical protein
MARGPEPLIGIASCFHRRRAFESMYEADTALALDLDAESQSAPPGAGCLVARAGRHEAA